MKAIIVKYVQYTNTKPAYYVAKAEGVAPVTRCVHSLNEKQPALAMARLLCHKYGWSVDLAGGELPNGDEVFCFRNQNRPNT